MFLKFEMWFDFQVSLKSDSEKKTRIMQNIEDSFPVLPSLNDSST